MLSALVDNSTLTAVQRLIGDIPVALSFAIEGDVAAYDQYLQTLLLYDEVAVIDDYKEEYRDERRNAFDEVRFIQPSSEDYETVSKLALDAVENISFDIRKGRLSPGPMTEFLTALDMHVLPAWYMASSNWFLHIRILADESNVNLDKYGALMNTIHAEVSQSERSQMPTRDAIYLESRDGCVLSTESKGDGSVADDVTRFALGLNWIAQRSAFYTLFAEKYHAAFSLHPIRHAFAAQYISSHLVRHQSPDMRKSTIEFFKAEVDKIRQASDDIIGSPRAPIQLPFLAAWAVGHAGNPRSGYDHIRQIRASKEALSLRSRFREIENLEREADQAALRKAGAKLRAAIANDLSELAKRFVTRSFTPQFDVSVDLIKLSPTMSLSGLVEGVSRVIPTANRKSTTLLRNISSDFMQIPMMGEISDRFSRSRKIRKGTEFVPDRTRIEEPKWRNTTSSWKRPL